MILNEAKAKIKELEALLKTKEAQGNTDTVTFFQLIGWSGAALVVGLVIGLLI